MLRQSSLGVVVMEQLDLSIQGGSKEAIPMNSSRQFLLEAGGGPQLALLDEADDLGEGNAAGRRK
jgi:hypothetical protein